MLNLMKPLVNRNLEIAEKINLLLWKLRDTIEKLKEENVLMSAETLSKGKY